MGGDSRLSLVLTAIQYVSQQFKFNSFVKYWKSQDDVQQWGLRQPRINTRKS